MRAIIQNGRQIIKDKVNLLLILYPSIVVRKPPFTLAEKGWGEFDMKVILYFVDKSIPPHELEHDLNFSKPHYEVLHTLVSPILLF